MDIIHNPFVGISPKGNTAAAHESKETDTPRRMNASPEGNIKLLDSFDLPAELMCCRFNPTGNLLAAGLSNGTIKVFTTDTRICAYSISNIDDKNSGLPVTCLRWKPDTHNQSYGNVLLATYASGDVKHWHVSSGKCSSCIREDRQSLATSYDSKASKFITGGSDAKIHMYDASTKQCITTMESSTNSEIMDGHMMRIFAVQFHPEDSNIFVSGGWDDTIQWWDIRENPKHSIRKIIGPHICGEGLDIDSDTLNIVTGSWRKEKNIQVWNFDSGKLLKEVPSDFNRSMIYSVQWKNKDTVLAGGSHCNMMRFVNCNTLQTTGRLMDLPGAVYSIDNNHKGAHPLVAVGSRQQVFLVQDTS